MKRVLLAACAGLGLAACADDYYGPYGYGGGYGGGYGYDLGASAYYDGYYGPYYDGYWGRDGAYYYSPQRGYPYRRGEARRLRAEWAC